MTLRLAAFQTPPGGDVVNDSPRTTRGTPIIIVKSVRLSSLCGLELICSATRQCVSSSRTLVCTRCRFYVLTFFFCLETNARAEGTRRREKFFKVRCQLFFQTTTQEKQRNGDDDGERKRRAVGGGTLTIGTGRSSLPHLYLITGK